MKVSILMPTYNRAFKVNGVYLVERAIISVLSQNYENYELLILNDGSTDKTSEVIQKYSGHPLVKIWDEKINRMPPNNMNFLWEQATGDLICQMHDDDVMPEDSISKRVKVFLDDSGIDVIYGGWQTQDINGKMTANYEATPPDPVRILQSEYINFTTLMYKRDLPFRFDAELRYYFDWLFKIRGLVQCKAGYVPGSVMIHTVHEGQETTKCRRENANTIQEKMMRDKLKELYWK